jgi:hypothetical protein
MTDQHLAVRALQCAAQNALPGEQPQSILLRAKHYLGFLRSPDGIAELTPEALKQIEALMAAKMPETVS